MRYSHFYGKPPKTWPGLWQAPALAHGFGSCEALLDFDLKKHRMSMNVNIVIDDPEELERVRQKEMDITKVGDASDDVGWCRMVLMIAILGYMGMGQNLLSKYFVDEHPFTNIYHLYWVH